MAKDSRPYLKLSLDFVNHPKVLKLAPGVRWVLLELWTHCATYRTDGIIDASAAHRIANARQRAALIEAGFMRRIENPAGFPARAENVQDDVIQHEICTQNAYEMHDYLAHQMSRAEQEEKARISRSNGRKGGRPKGSKKNPAGFATGTQTEPEIEVEVEVPTYVGTAARNVPSASTQQPEVSTHFADGTPIPGEASAAVVPIRRPARATDAARTLARLGAPDGTPRAAIDDLAGAIQALIDDPDVHRPDLEAAIAAWWRRPGIGVGLLRGLVLDAAKARAGGASGPPGARPEAKQRTYANLIAKLETQAAQQQEIES
ncbi:hypothetical protein [Tsukamurella sp. NPDC003166]|uniref:hypothetical protein n=1 Tax=Tsukamurella sp. NPDC003166 TaxID=3154444 RepID=UPI00339F1BF4